jgi:hypothetical protein
VSLYACACVCSVSTVNTVSAVSTVSSVSSVNSVSIEGFGGLCEKQQYLVSAWVALEECSRQNAVR